LEEGFKLNKAVKLNERDCNIIYADVNKMEAIYQEKDDEDDEEKLQESQKKVERQNLNYLASTITVPEPFNLHQKKNLTIVEKNLLETYIKEEKEEQKILNY